MSDDPYADDVVVLLPFDGDEGSTDAIDHATRPGVVDFFGDAKLTLVGARDGRAALFCEGPSSYVQWFLSPAYPLRNVDFTIEFWLCQPVFSSSMETILDWRSDYRDFRPWIAIFNGQVTLRDHADAMVRVGSLPGDLQEGVWHHIAISVSNGDFKYRLFVDGVLSNDGTIGTLYDSQTWIDLRIGRNVRGATPQNFHGMLQDLRITLGACRYVAGFTPPARLIGSSGGGATTAWCRLPSPLGHRSAFGHSAWANVSTAAPWIDAPEIKYFAQPWLSLPVLRSSKISQGQVSALLSGSFDASGDEIVFAYRVVAAAADMLRITVQRADTGQTVLTLTDVGGLGDWAQVSFDPSVLPPDVQYQLLFSFSKHAPTAVGADGAFLVPLSGFPLPTAWCGAASPLGTVTTWALSPAQSFITTKARIASPLQAPVLIAARLSRAMARVPSPLCAPVLFAAPPVLGWSAVTGVLGAPMAIAASRPSIWSRVPSPVGVVSARGRQVRALNPPLLVTDLLDVGVGASLLSDLLPLRRTVQLPQFRVDTWLPWVYGYVTLAAIGLDADRLEWLIADHPVTAVESVEVGGVPTDGWQLIQRIDENGHPIALIRLTQPAKISDQVAVRVVGKRHPRTGEVLTSPSQIAIDVLSACGWQLSADAFGDLDDDLAGTEIGVVFDNPVGVRQALGRLFDPLGVIWAAGPLATPSARIDAPGAPSFLLDAMSCEDISARAEHTTLATVARVAFDYDWAAKSARQAMTLHAPEAIDRHGEIVVDLDMPTVRTARDALALGSLILARRARAQWAVEAEMVSRSVLPQPGDTVRIEHPHVPSGLAVVRARTLSRQDHLARLTLIISTGIVPAVTLAGRSRLFSVAGESMIVQYRDGWATFTITDDHGNVLSGAAVTLDGTLTRNTDATGRVQFKTQRGRHILTVNAHGYAPFEMEVEV